MEIEEAIARISGAVSPIAETRIVPLWDAYGYVTAEEITAGVSVPAFPRSAMDGYAVDSKEVAGASGEDPVSLKVCAEILAGDHAALSHTPGTAVRVMTGGMIPEGYDAVVRQEDTDGGEGEVRIFKPVPAFGNYCPVGEEIRKGDTVVKAGTRIGRTEAGLLATLGLSEIKVRRAVRTALISTGSELTDPGRPLSSGKIYNSIRYILGTAIRQERLEVAEEASCPDETESIIAAIGSALQKADVILTTGGVSVGKRDLLPEVLKELGAQQLFRGVNIQPGTPTIGSVLDGRIILSLSGNPYAAMANFDLYFWPAVAGLSGCSAYLSEETQAVLADVYEKENRMRRLVRAREAGGKVYLPAADHKSSVFGNTSMCNCYMDLPAGCRVTPGDTVKIRKMRSGF